MCLCYKADITKADDSEFVPSFPNGTNTDFSSLGNFIVAKVHIIGELDMKRDSDFTPVDSGTTFYAVVPESYLGTREFVGQAGNVDEFSFDYNTICIHCRGTRWNLYCGMKKEMWLKY